jgi:SAM-dependent methyltransferase
MADGTNFTNHSVMDGESKIRVDRRPSIKLKGDPHIVVCMPVGDKHTQTVLECPDDQGGCGKKWQAPGMQIPALVPVQWALSHMNLITPLNTTMSYLVEYGRLSAEARQIMTQQAIRMNAKYVLYWDDDTLPPQLGLYTLHNWMERHPEAGAISGVYTTRENPNEPLIYTHHGEGAAWDFPMGPGAEPVPIFGAGAGFLLARVEAIVDTQKKLGEGVPIWADERTVPGSDPQGQHNRRIMWGHDVRFCNKLNNNDWPVYVHGQVLCDHLDIGSATVHSIPDDTPGLLTQQRKNINTQAYWNNLYGQEGTDTWRKYEEMFGRVENEVDKGDSVVELGCGVGVLGQRLVARNAVSYRGYDISDVAVEACRARFMHAERLDLKEIESAHVEDADTVVATEVMEHLDEFTYNKVMDAVTRSSAKKFIFTVPDNCMGPDEVPEHTALFNEELIRGRYAALMGRHDDILEAGRMWDSLTTRKADESHLICILER